MLIYRLTSWKVFPHFTMNFEWVILSWYDNSSVLCSQECYFTSAPVNDPDHMCWFQQRSLCSKLFLLCNQWKHWTKTNFVTLNPAHTKQGPAIQLLSLNPVGARAQPGVHSALVRVPGLTSAPRRVSFSPHQGCWGVHQGNAAVWSLTCSSFGCYGNCLFPGNHCQNKNSFVLNFLSYLWTL